MLEEEQGFTSEELAQLVVSDDDQSTESQSESESETPAPSQEESKDDVQETEKTPEDSASTKEVPFHKHPRWIRQQREIEDLRKQLESQKVVEPVVEKQEDKQVPREFERLFGDDYEAYEAWKTLMDRQASEKAREVLESRDRERSQRENQEKERETKAIEMTENAFLELSEETGLDLTDAKNSERNQILDICLKYELWDKDGLPNVRKANELRAQLYPEKPNELVEEKKRIVKQTGSQTNAAPKEHNVWTPSSLRKKSISQFFN